MRQRLRTRAFTLVELLVVIGIIAILIGVLLPVLSRVQGRSLDLKCQTQLSQMGGMIAAYAAENRGSLPYGLYFVHANAQGQPTDQEQRFVFWGSMLGKYAGRGRVGDNWDDSSFPPWLQCPSAAQVYPHVVGYVASMVMFPRLDSEIPDTPVGQPVLKPASLAGLKPPADKILIHDTAVLPGLENNIGWAVNYDVDNQRFAYPQNPQHRFFDRTDPYAKFAPGILGNNRPVRFHSAWQNRDLSLSDRGGAGFGWGPYQGNIRFRHNRNTVAYALFADGHVGPLTARFNPDGSMVAGTCNALRRCFMPQWQTGINRNPLLP